MMSSQRDRIHSVTRSVLYVHLHQPFFFFAFIFASLYIFPLLFIFPCFLFSGFKTLKDRAWEGRAQLRHATMIKGQRLVVARAGHDSMDHGPSERCERSITSPCCGPKDPSPTFPFRAGAPPHPIAVVMILRLLVRAFFPKHLLPRHEKREDRIVLQNPKCNRLKYASSPAMKKNKNTVLFRYIATPR